MDDRASPLTVIVWELGVGKRTLAKGCWKLQQTIGRKKSLAGLFIEVEEDKTGFRQECIEMPILPIACG
jgi:hypothetical protein